MFSFRTTWLTLRRSAWRERNSNRPGHDTLVAVALKLALLAALYLFFFAPSHRPTVNASVIATALVGERHSQDAP